MKTVLIILLSIGLWLPLSTASAMDDSFGTPLPADGGAPFAAYQERIAAIHSADWAVFRRHTSPDEIQAEIAAYGSEAAAEAEFREMVEFLRMMTPAKASFIEGWVDGDRARVMARTVRPAGALQGADAPVTITLVELRLANGHWYVENESLHAIAE